MVSHFGGCLASSLKPQNTYFIAVLPYIFVRTWYQQSFRINFAPHQINLTSMFLYHINQLCISWAKVCLFVGQTSWWLHRQWLVGNSVCKNHIIPNGYFLLLFFSAIGTKRRIESRRKSNRNFRTTHIAFRVHFCHLFIQRSNYSSVSVCAIASWLFFMHFMLSSAGMKIHIKCMKNLRYPFFNNCFFRLLQFLHLSFISFCTNLFCSAVTRVSLSAATAVMVSRSIYTRRSFFFFRFCVCLICKVRV